MDKPMTRRATIYIRNALSAAIGPTLGGELSQRLAAMGVRYSAFVDACMPELTRGEWCAIMDANNGGSDVWAADGHVSPSGIWANVADSEGFLAKWGVDNNALAQKLSEMARPELLAVDEAIGRFWARCDMDTDDALRESGCLIAD